MNFTFFYSLYGVHGVRDDNGTFPMVLSFFLLCCSQLHSRLAQMLLLLYVAVHCLMRIPTLKFCRFSEVSKRFVDTNITLLTMLFYMYLNKKFDSNLVHRCYAE